MISVWIEQLESRWYGAALHEGALVAAAAASSRAAVQRAILRSLPAEAPRGFLEQATDEARAAVCMLAELERGNETAKRVVISPLYVREPLRSVLLAAAAIPLGYVATYGSIARAAHTDARTVGQVMAANPLYPAVACHRVVGSDLSLVGYGGSRKSTALKAKLDRLRAEKRGFAGRSTLDVLGGMEVVPVEWAIAKAAKDGLIGTGQLPLW